MRELYMKDPNITGEELRKHVIDKGYELPGSTGIPIRFYLPDPGLEPSEELVNTIAEEIQATEGIPGGRYSIFLNDNYIIPKQSFGEKENSISIEFYKESEM